MSVFFGIAGTLTVCLTAFVVYISKIRRRAVDYSELLCRRIDGLIDGGYDVEAPPESGDSLISKTEDKLLKLGEVLRLRSERNEEAHERLQALVSDISHQVKTPLSVIRMYSDVLKDRDVDDEKRIEMALAIGRQTEKLEFLTGALLKMSRLETGIIKLSPAPHPVARTIEDAASGIRQAAGQKGITVTVSCDPSVIAMHDPKWTSEAIYNLLDNAVKYTPPGGSVSVDVRQWEVRTRIEIADSGKGISPANIGSVFTRFYREPEAHGVGGVGLGLTLTRKICNMQGGNITVRSEPGKGSVFSVFLPNS